MKTKLSSLAVLVRLAGTAPSLPSAPMIAGRDRGSSARVIVRAMTFALLCLALSCAALAFAAPVGPVPDEVLVRFRAGTSAARRNTLHAAAGATVVRQFRTVPDLHLIKLPVTARALAHYGASPDVLYVERNHAITLQRMPDDPRFVEGDPGVWGLDMVPLFGDADIDGPEAWDITTGSRDVVVATIDSGIDYTHEDLAANMWRNEADCNGDGVDNDGNGFVDDCYGIAPINGNSDPMDDHSHGTHVAGIIGAVGNNGIGVVGVNWNVRLMPCKMFDADGYGSLAAAIACLDYIAIMKDRGVNVVATNNSWSDNEYSAALRDAIDAHRQRGILFVAAAGNYYQCGNDPFECRTDPNNDRKPTWPANYQLPNIISVANSVTYGFLNAASGRGRRTVHLAAPGTFILSTTPANTYDYFTGTSMAAPHVTGVAALLKAQDMHRDWRAIRNLILAGTDGDLYPDDDDLITLKRLNARGALACANSTVTSRLRPIPASVTGVVGRPMELSVLNINCAVPNGDVTVTVNPGGQTVTLRDDGAGIDQAAGDGTYSGQWTPPAEGTFSLTFPGADVVTVQVLPSGVYTVAAVPFGDRAITGTPLQIFPWEPVELVSPFPLRFAGGSFTSLFVDERGAVHFDGNGFETALTPYSEPLPSPYHSTLIAPFWDRIRPLTAGVGEVVWEVTGTAPNRELVVEWRNLERSDVFCELLGGFVSFQAVFFEGSSDILFNYRDTVFGGYCGDLDGGGTATVGIQVSPDVATMFSFHTAALADGTSLLWTLGQAPQPAIAVTPASRDFGTVTVGATKDMTFAVQNVGTGTLTGEAKTAAPFSIVSGGTYSLAAGQTQTVTVRFSPTSADPFVSDVTFTGGDNPSRSVRGVGAATNVAPDPPSALGQFRTDGTALGVGAWTNQTSMVLKFTMVDATLVDTLRPEVEIKPVGTAFTGAGLLVGTAVASTGAPVQGVVPVTGLTNGSQYHWRARTRDAAGLTSGWVSFGGNAETASDVGVDTAVPSGSIVVASGSPWTKGRAVNLSLKCADTKSGCSQMQLAQDTGTFTPPEPFVASRAFTLAGADGKKTVNVRYIDGAGNSSKSYADTITLDTTAPVVTAVSATPSPFVLGATTTTIRFRAADALSGTCHADIRIRNAGGGIVRSFSKSAGCAVGGTVTSTIWDGRNAAHALVPPGTYTIEVVVTDAAGNVSAVGSGSVVAQ